MARPTILIGIGSGGLRSIEAAWKLSQEVIESERPIVEYIYLETDKSNQPVSPDIVYSSLTLNNTQATVHAIKSNLSCTSSWLSGHTIPTNVFAGAGGAPLVGRLTLWDSENRTDFVNKLSAALTRICQRTLEKPLVYVVGSFGGGTGSGTFLDIAYLIRDTLANKVELQGLFLIPNVGLSDHVIYSNTICCLKELDYFNNENNEFPFKWSANPPKGYEAINTPYDLIQIISAAYNDVLPPVNYGTLHEEAGLFLYLNALGLYDVRRKSLVDAASNLIIDKYTTFGLAAIHYPESDIKEILGNQFTAEMLSIIIDDAQYFDKQHDTFKNLSSATPHIVNSIKKSFDDEFVKILKQWCNQINIVEAGETLPVEIHIEHLAHTLASSNYTYDEKRKLLFNLFKVGGEYYKQLKNLSTTYAVDKVVELIVEKIASCLEEYNNINVAIIELEAIESVLREIQNFWSVNGYTSNGAQWDENLKKYIKQDILPMPFVYKTLFEAKNVYVDKISFILMYGLAMHIFSDKLSTIISGIQGTQVQLNMSDGKTMPTVAKLKAWKDVIARVIDNPNNAIHLSCMQVVKSLKSKLSSQCSNISYIYPNGSLVETLSMLDKDYRANHGQFRFISDVTGDGDLYSFLCSLQPNGNIGDVYAEKDLYTKVVPAYIAQVSTGEFSVAQAVNSADYNNLINNVEKKSLIPHLPINPPARKATFKDHIKVPHILSGFDGPANDVIDKITIKLEQDLQIHDYKVLDKDRNKFSHSGLNNWLVFYKEFGHMSDGVPFNIINDLRDFNDFANCYSAGLLNTNNDGGQTYHEMRMPYVDYTSSQKIAKKYEQEAINKKKILEYETAIQLYNYATYWDMGNAVFANKTAELSTLLKNETITEQFSRYYDIATRYMQTQDFPTAREYYSRASKLDPHDPNAIAQINKIDSICTRVSAICGEGDNMKENADSLYEQFIQGNAMDKAQCIAAYNEVKNKYTEALQLSQHDEVVKHKILDVDRRLSTLNM
jgi:hypothetical protein